MTTITLSYTIPPTPAIGAYISLSLTSNDLFFSLSGKGQGSGRRDMSSSEKSPHPILNEV